MKPRNTKVRYGWYSSGPQYTNLFFFPFFQLRMRLQLLVSTISAKSGLESCAYNLCHSLSDKKFADKFEPADKSNSETTVNEAGLITMLVVLLLVAIVKVYLACTRVWY